MKKQIITLLVILTAQLSFAQEKSGFRMAYNLSNVQGDFGQGVQLESPSFLHNSVTMKIRATQMYLNYDLSSLNKWSPYWNLGLGLANNPVQISSAVNLYGEGGVMYLLPNSDFSSSNGELAGYGVFGFNFNFAPSFCYFMEAGGIGSSAKAEKSDNQRIYSNGFIMQVGLKIHFVAKNKE